MHKLSYFFAFSLFLLSSLAHSADLLFEGQKVEPLKASIVDIFVNQKFDVDQDSPTRLVLSQEIKGGTGFAINFLQTLVATPNNAAAGDNPRFELNFTFIQKPEGVKVVAGAVALTTLDNGNIKRQRLDDSEASQFLDLIYQKIMGKRISSSRPEFQIVKETPIIMLGDITYSVKSVPTNPPAFEMSDNTSCYANVKEKLTFGEPVNEDEARKVLDVYLRNTVKNYKDITVTKLGVKSGQYVVWCNEATVATCPLMMGLAGTVVAYSYNEGGISKERLLVMRKFSPKPRAQ